MPSSSREYVVSALLAVSLNDHRPGRGYWDGFRKSLGEGTLHPGANGSLGISSRLLLESRDCSFTFLLFASRFAARFIACIQHAIGLAFAAFELFAQSNWLIAPKALAHIDHAPLTIGVTLFQLLAFCGQCVYKLWS